MKILIDARMYGLEHAGIGRYVMNLVDQLSKAKSNNYTLLINESQLNNWKIKNSLKIENCKLEIINPSIKHYSLREQLELPGILNKLDFDLAHFPHFNVPLFFNKPYVVTIHDLIKHTSRGMQTTTRDPILYWIKYFGYKIVFGNAVRRARKIMVPSNAVKDDLLSNYDIAGDKVKVIYEGVDEIFKSQITKRGTLRVHKSQTILQKYKINKPYVIYTGSVYPHKNLERLIEAVKIINQKSLIISLVIVSSRNVFIDRLGQFIKKSHADKFVNLPGFVEDSELAELYKNAEAFVFPSLSEGFGLPGLEAMASGCPVLCSDIPVFHEIYGDAATYFNPYDVQDISSKINEVFQLNETERKERIKMGMARSKQFSWHKMAQETLEIYNSVV